MANPAVTTMNTEWTWTKVATNITLGNIHLVNRAPRYYRTYRLTGEAAPTKPNTGTIPDEAIQIFVNKTEELIRTKESVDIYLFCICNNSKNIVAGKVEVDS